MKDRKIIVNWLFLIVRTCPKTLKNLHDSSLEIFNKTQWFLQKPSHLVICELSSNSNIVKFLCESHILRFWDKF
ncbi:hypothetical protein Lepto1548_08120 [Leptospira interrogans serovar Bataviae]|nr:hypothetical protein Lepto1548_08120 [Leptospira interrogans serovar Bataviae]